MATPSSMAATRLSSVRHRNSMVSGRGSSASAFAPLGWFLPRQRAAGFLGAHPIPQSPLRVALTIDRLQRVVVHLVLSRLDQGPQLLDARRRRVGACILRLRDFSPKLASQIDAVRRASLALHRSRGAGAGIRRLGQPLGLWLRYVQEITQLDLHRFGPLHIARFLILYRKFTLGILGDSP